MIVLAIAWVAGSMGFVVGAWWASSAFARQDGRVAASPRPRVAMHRHVGAPTRPTYRRRGRPVCTEIAPLGSAQRLTG